MTMQSAATIPPRATRSLVRLVPAMFRRLRSVRFRFCDGNPAYRKPMIYHTTNQQKSQLCRQGRQPFPSGAGSPRWHFPPEAFSGALPTFAVHAAKAASDRLLLPMLKPGWHRPRAFSSGDSWRSSPMIRSSRRGAASARSPRRHFPPGGGGRSTPNNLFCTPRGGFFGVAAPRSKARRAAYRYPLFHE